VLAPFQLACTKISPPLSINNSEDMDEIPPPAQARVRRQCEHESRQVARRAVRRSYFFVFFFSFGVDPCIHRSFIYFIQSRLSHPASHPLPFPLVSFHFTFFLSFLFFFFSSSSRSFFLSLALYSASKASVAAPNMRLSSPSLPLPRVRSISLLAAVLLLIPVVLASPVRPAYNAISGATQQPRPETYGKLQVPLPHKKRVCISTLHNQSSYRTDIANLFTLLAIAQLLLACLSGCCRVHPNKSMHTCAD